MRFLAFIQVIAKRKPHEHLYISRTSGIEKKLTETWVCLSINAEPLDCCSWEKTSVNIQKYERWHTCSLNVNDLVKFNKLTTHNKALLVSQPANKVPFAYMKWDIFSIEVFYHCPAGLVHQLLGQTKTSVGSLYCLNNKNNKMNHTGFWVINNM